MRGSPDARSLELSTAGSKLLYKNGPRASASPVALEGSNQVKSNQIKSQIVSTPPHQSHWRGQIKSNQIKSGRLCP